MVKAAAVFAIAIVAIFASVVPAPAVAIYSAAGGDGVGALACTVNALCTTGTVVNVDPRPTPPWVGVVLGGRQWVSYANTGSGLGTVPGPVNVAGLALGQQSVTFTYTLAASALPSILNLSIWADDTAGVRIDGNPWTILPAADPGGYLACSSIAIGCSSGTQGLLAAALTAGVEHVISFDVFQAGGDGTPFGLSFEGDLAAVPEPATILLLGSALAAAGVASRRRFQKTSQQ